MPGLLAAVVVFLTSGAVLVLEILAARLLAPYVGVTLETYTAIIGTVLAGIALGTWAGGRLADRVEPRRLLGPLVVAGGGLSLATIPLVRLLGTAGGGAGEDQAVVLAAVGFFLPAAVLSGVTPTVIKLQLRDLAATGSVVGHLSAVGTVGAIAGTFLAGFVLVEAAATSTSITVLGAGLVAGGVALWVWAGALTRLGLVWIGAAALVGAGLSTAVGDPCDTETTYHCARVEADPSRPGGRVLVLDTLRHSYVDLDDPTHLEFRYIQVFADVIGAAAPPGPLDVVHVGGGGFTMPRSLAAERPGSTNLVLEIDGGLVELAERQLDLEQGPRLDVRVGDARLLLADVPPQSHDVVIGDAFGGLAVPWHLTTLEAVAEVRRVLRPDGLYVVNVIDFPPLRFARAEVATLARLFDHVAVVAPESMLEGDEGGNLVLVGSDEALDVDGIRRAIARRGGIERVLAGGAVDDFRDDAPVLTDDRAPVDQWLARAARPSL